MDKRFRRIRIALMIISSLVMLFLIGILTEAVSPVISAEEFLTRMEEAGYAVEESTTHFEGIDVHLIADCDMFF